METAVLHTLYRRCTSVQIDSRQCGEGDMFFALHGTTDGNAFAKDALARGAAFAVVDDQALAATDRCIWVPDTLKALQELARYHRRFLGIPVIALTGSNGKTTTKELLARVLAKKYAVHATQGNYNNHIGVPLTLLSIPQGTEMAIIEMGANAQGEIATLCAIAEPDFGLITNIGKAHLLGFGGEEGVRKGKGEMYDHLKAHRKHIFYLASEAWLPEMVGDYHNATRAQIGDADQPGTYAILEDLPRITIAYKDVMHQKWRVTSPLFGGHNAKNIITALMVGRHFRVPDKDMAEAIASYIPSNNRSQIVHHGSTRIIMDAYNANPSSMKEILASFKAMTGNHKMVILGDMGELDHTAQEEHQQVVNQLLDIPDLEVVLVGSLFNNTKRPDTWHWFPDAAAVRQWLLAQNLNNRQMLVKGSRSQALELAVDFLIN
jgi:UDP-N-acetylmuramoyl-tripeptide--D-alanyl-D-alanine ligase